MISIGQKFPQFALTGVVSNDIATAFKPFDNTSAGGKWQVVFFWPKDFTFVCPTEIAEFGRKNGEFADRDAQVLGASVDSEFVHLAWRKDHKDLRGLPFPMLADIRKDPELFNFAMAGGRSAFQTNCMQCHGAGGGGHVDRLGQHCDELGVHHDTSGGHVGDPSPIGVSSSVVNSGCRRSVLARSASKAALELPPR